MAKSSQITPSQALAAFLSSKTHADLAAQYSYDMEVQVNVAQDDGQRIQKQSGYTGRMWNGFTDGLTTWKPFRIPWNAATEPNYTEIRDDGKIRAMQYDLSLHAEGIGMTGWDWKNQMSRWVAYDFDSIVGHSTGLTADELQKVEEIACAIPWVTVRKSTSGSGLHIYVYLDIATKTHTEHAALARAVLGKMSAETGFDFNSKVDICGGNMWIWHRKMTAQNKGLKLLKQGVKLLDVPANWKDHLVVIRGNRRKNLPQFVGDNNLSVFDELTGQRPRVKLDDEHRKLLDYLKKEQAQWWWDADHWMLVCHTSDLKSAHKALSFRGIFDTVATGKEAPDHNCLSGDAEILTKSGPRVIRDIAKDGGDHLYVHTLKGMEWLWCEVKSFGIQETVPIDFGNQTTVRATLNHGWFYGDFGFGKTKKTYELRTNNGKNHGDYLPLASQILPEIDYESYAHGFVYGDGWCVNTRGKTSCAVTLFKNDEDLVRLLANYGNVGSERVEGHGYLPTVRQLPDDWKHLPDNPTKKYALGFILGLISADGFIHKCGTICIYQSNYDALQKIRKMAIYAGLRTRDVRLYTDGSGYNSENSGWALTIESYNLTADHFIRRDHKANFKQKTKCHTTTVNKIDFDAKITEEVFCAVVPSYHNFTLANNVISSNCFAFPIEHPSGAWSVRRYSLGIQESPNWEQDSTGYTRCFYNQEPTLRTAANMYSGVEDEKGFYHFSEAEAATTVATRLGVELKLPLWACARPTILKQHKDGRLVVNVRREPNDRPEDMVNWREEKGWWKRIFNARITAPNVLEVGNFDHIVRHIVDTEYNDLGWSIHSNGTWRNEPLHHVKMALKTKELSAKDTELVLGRCVSESWMLVNDPFQEEYPGNRNWNRYGVQCTYTPKQTEPFSCPTWDSILNHVGSGLDTAIKEDGWCLANGIETGSDYLRCWVASLFQEPKEPLPYLFFYSQEENTGKSTLHEALSLLMTPRGYARADTALTSQQSFNAELSNAILCVVQETDLRRSAGARNRLKDWVTATQLSIHEKGRTPYLVTNTTHYIHTANDPGECPIFPGDSRITMGYVKPIEIMDLVPKRELFRRLKKEAPDFMAIVLKIDIPECTDRLRIPIISTTEKQQSQQLNRTLLEEFLEEQTYEIPGEKILYSDLYDAFVRWLDPNDKMEWTKIKMGREIPLRFPKGRLPSDGSKFYIGNLSFTESTHDAHNPRFVLRGANLETLS